MILAGYYTGSLTHNCLSGDGLAWGCKSPARRPRWNLPCIYCLGNKGNVDCKFCNGRGVVGQDRCPTSTNTNTMNKAFNYYTSLDNHNTLPNEGGLMDQPTIFVKVVHTIPSLLSAWESLSQRKKEALKRLKDGAKTRN